MIIRSLTVSLILIVACMFMVVPHSLAETMPTQELYILPFNQGSTPADVTNALFDALVENLYVLGEQRGIQVTIVKQELTDADVDLFAGKQYLIGEVTAYSEEKGCCYTELKLTGQVQLHRPEEQKLPVLELSDETFFNHDITLLPVALAELTGRLGKEIAEQLLMQIPAN